VNKSLIKKAGVAAVGIATLAGLTLSAAPANAAGEKIVFIQGVKGDGFYITMGCGIQKQAKKDGVSVTIEGPAKFDATLQKPILDAVVAKKPAAILIAPNDVNAMQKPLAAAAAKGIKIVLVDTTVKDPSFAVSQISSDNYGGGKKAFEAIQQLVPGGGDVMVIGVKPGISTTDARDKGFEDAAKAAGAAWNFIGTEYSQNEPAIAAQIVTAALAKNPNLKGIFASNLFSAQGAATGIKQAGKEGQVKIIGFDAGPDQVAALKAGTVQALIAQQPGVIGTQGVKQAVAALRGGKTTPKITTGFKILTPANVDTNFGKTGQYLSTCS
jgi:ribose transport system substrate-binding protein